MPEGQVNQEIRNTKNQPAKPLEDGFPLIRRFGDVTSHIPEKDVTKVTVRDYAPNLSGQHKRIIDVMLDDGRFIAVTTVTKEGEEIFERACQSKGKGENAPVFVDPKSKNSGNDPKAVMESLLKTLKFETAETEQLYEKRGEQALASA